ncbi:hypothetical protein T08_14097 [Trichinella sp. T8]|nr:hypothetical protein T08_14097 [Trichinella sp. T8]
MDSTENGIGIVSGTKINHYKYEKIQSTTQQFQMKKRLSQ